MLCEDSMEFAGKARGYFPIARKGRQGCLADGFFMIVALDSTFRWLHELVTSRGPFFPDCTPCV